MADGGRGRAGQVLGLVGFAARGATGVARMLPGAGFVEDRVDDVRRLWLRDLKRQLDALEPPRDEADSTPTPAEAMDALLRRSLEESPADSRRAHHLRLLEQLVPDEARMLAAAADGSAYPLLHVTELGVGPLARRVLENASTLGRQAGVALPARTPVYVSHLLDLGLLRTGEEDPALRDEYEVLLTEPAVADALARLGKGPLTGRVQRRTVRISPLGAELWEATQR